MPALHPVKRGAPLRIAVVGAGVIGLSVALELRGRGAEVVVYDRATELGAGATTRSAGMLGAAFEWALEGDQRALAALARHAGMLWPDFAARVERLGGGSVEYSREGAIVIARRAAENEWLGGLAGACQARGFEARSLNAQDARRIEPALGDSVSAALLLNDDRQVDPVLLVQRLGAALSRSGVAMKLGRPVERIVGGQVFQMPDGDRFDRIVLATGVSGIPEFVGPRGAELRHGLPRPIPVKGQMLALAPVAGVPRHVIHTRDVYIAPKSRWILVGSTTERGLESLSVDIDVIGGLRKAAAEIAPALADAPEITAWAGIRPGSADDAPLLGQTGIPGVLAALGHYRNGVLFAPAAAQLVADQAIDGKVSPLAAAFDPLRFDKDGEASHSRSGGGLVS